MEDELSKKRRQKATLSNEVMPKDALLETIEMIDQMAECEVHKVEHVFCLTMINEGGDNQDLFITSAGSRNPDEVIGALNRAIFQLVSGGMLP